MSLNLAARPAEGARVLCPACLHLAASPTLILDGETVSISCEECETVTVLGKVSKPQLRLVPVVPPVLPVVATRVIEPPAPPPPAPMRVDVSVPQTHCPKCVAPRGSAKTCVQCGLDFERGQAPELPAWLVTEWSKTTKDWRSLERHQRLIDQATQSDALWAVGRLYRLHLVLNPDDTVAQQACAEVVLRASAILVPSPREKSDRLKRAALGFGVLLSLLLAMIAVGLN
ncbi:MAG: hypothetical protein QM817_15910 [Archangium sp.]